ncbi:MAG: Asparagine synthetase [glutamine-hydrolyzing] (EC [uncultured Thiotrichaceae bacterium]|uniref:asparagine synthase (glutamine-hydrolyzing) n=1 Tax=uncultured Thiotrichaceae bacterium TaxID=298394 RepID=A0A6S6SFR1_9GAMM|nr:MAG: Asparagine synthetase [glutamine-hydrolyzing] (EC [uncultured Thiotrichaceae bacterium]
MLVSMADAIQNRGPDDAGYWVDEKIGLALGHRRLSIQDLSAAGHQPMASASDRFMMVYNGEVYNFNDIKDELEDSDLAPTWRGHSDTEILLAGFEAWGVVETIKRMVGMFALALYDRLDNKMYLVRDRMGEKPLYFGWQGDSFLFGSELKALKQHARWQGEINRDALSSYLRFSYVPAPYSIYQDIYKLKPGCYIEIDLDVFQVGYLPDVQSYWSVDQAAANGMANPFEGSKDDVVDELERLLKQSLRGQMIADVPLGAFLSGGIDSSTIVALMQALSDKPVNTFSIGFNEEGYNEALHAKVVAEHLGTQHTELYVTAQQSLDVIPELPRLYDEPFADPSQIPTYLVSELAKQKVTVSLSGDAGDELFCGYSRYQHGLDLWEKINRFPDPFRKLVEKMIGVVPPFVLNALFSWADRYLTGAETAGDAAYKMKVLGRVIASNNIQALYQFVISSFKDPDLVVRGGKEDLSVFYDDKNMSERFSENPAQGFMYYDQHLYLPDDILTKVDRAAMGVSLEGRIPMLDHRIIEFAWTIPHEHLNRDGQSKWPLRQVLYKHVPEKLVNRPKMGFGVPIDEWLRKDIKPWAEELLASDRIKEEGYFNPELIRTMWDEHQAGTRDWNHRLWAVLMFQQWNEYQ